LAEFWGHSRSAAAPELAKHLPDNPIHCTHGYLPFPAKRCLLPVLPV
jgi:hypothetical protein